MSSQRHPPQKPHDHAQRGALLMGLLIVLALSGIALMGAIDVWTTDRQREREQQLLFAGAAYRQAIRHYYFGAPPGSPRSLPTSLDALLDDERYPMPVHHLRRHYPDPMSGATDWGELRVGDAIAGVYSRSEAQPIKQANFSLADAGFVGKPRYKDWLFVFGEAPGVAVALEEFGTTPHSLPAELSSRTGARGMK